MFKALFNRSKQHQNIFNKQTVDPAAFNSDNFV